MELLISSKMINLNFNSCLLLCLFSRGNQSVTWKGKAVEESREPKTLNNSQDWIINIWNTRTDSAKKKIKKKCHSLFLPYKCYFLTSNSIFGLDRKNLISYEVKNSRLTWLRSGSQAGLTYEALWRHPTKETHSPQGIWKMERNLERFQNCKMLHL